MSEQKWTTVACNKRLWFTFKNFAHSQGVPAQAVLEGLIERFLQEHQVRLLEESQFNRKQGPPERDRMVRHLGDRVVRDLVGMVK